MIKVCFIGACGHSFQAYHYLKTREDIEFCGYAKGSEHEKFSCPFDNSIKLFEDYSKMLDETKPDLAVVSPVFGLTGKIIIECAKRKINVFAEKPIAATLEELERVKTAVSDNKIRFSAMHYLRFDPAFYTGAKIVHEGKIGEIKMITAQKSYRYGVRPEWYKDKKLYVGTIAWVGIHAVDWISYFSGKKFISASSKTIGENPEMAAICSFELEGGIIASANIDYYRPNNIKTHGDDRVRCVGTKGILEVRDGKIYLMNQDGESEITPSTAPEPLEEFLSGKDIIPPEEIFHITEVALKAQLNAK